MLQLSHTLRFFSPVRIAGGALVVAGQLAKTPNPMILNAAYILDYVGISAILLSTLGFIGMAYVIGSIHIVLYSPTISSGQHTYSENRRLIISLRFTGFFILAGVGVGAAGGAIGDMANANTSLATALAPCRRVHLRRRIYLHCGPAHSSLDLPLAPPKLPPKCEYSTAMYSRASC